MKPMITAAALFLFIASVQHNNLSVKNESRVNTVKKTQQLNVKQTNTDVTYINNDSDDYAVQIKDAATNATISTFHLYGATTYTDFLALPLGTYNVEITKWSGASAVVPCYVYTPSYNQSQVAGTPVVFTNVTVNGPLSINIW
ncbi:hypothetical protein [Sediminibacterium ginsengisoli]|uniref:Por secretion system C-terminal sorting domain-containing protein n=1 Tax=Sediminibacterium ginsengisoli TaxID=413434 RepID=A0A1T4M853_9BACT|nr:hypothetical protein [Sediminibacterium ginsengisoli]SJZ62968.1 hypothetical protein SAMN04488132_103229 [Sediminibacterium ginsengisoli]